MINILEEVIVNETLPNTVFDGDDFDNDMEIIEQLYAQMMGWI